MSFARRATAKIYKKTRAGTNRGRLPTRPLSHLIFKVKKYQSRRTCGDGEPHQEHNDSVEMLHLTNLRAILDEETAILNRAREIFNEKKMILDQKEILLEEKELKLNEKESTQSERELLLNDREAMLNSEREKLDEAKLSLQQREWAISRANEFEQTATNTGEEESKSNYAQAAKENFPLIDTNSPEFHDATEARVCAPIEEDEFDDLVPSIKATPPRSFARESIGQWSTERKRNNMSVQSIVSSFQSKTSTTRARK